MCAWWKNTTTTATTSTTTHQKPNQPNLNQPFQQQRPQRAEKSNREWEVEVVETWWNADYLDLIYWLFFCALSTKATSTMANRERYIDTNTSLIGQGGDWATASNLGYATHRVRMGWCGCWLWMWKKGNNKKKVKNKKRGKDRISPIQWLQCFICVRLFFLFSFSSSFSS